MNVVDAAITARAPRGPQIYSHGTLTLGAAELWRKAS
jgi:hypothetical protein